MRLPVVVVGQSGQALGCPAVRLDNFEAARAMVGHLTGLGHRRIGCLAVPDHDINISTLRKEGYKAALRAAGLAVDEELIVIGDFEYPSGEAGASRLMSARGERPTAIYCITDRLAVAASSWLMRQGFDVPGDVSVACVDDPPLLAYCHPRITTMSFDYHAAGAAAGQLIIDCIDGKQPPVKDVVMPYTLRLRDSTRRLDTPPAGFPGMKETHT
jgi:DNA-binding LacI/PurR family transcriptional regulator